jgi:hypothetical protein
VLAPSFETITEQDEELETGSQDFQRKRPNSVEDKLVESLICPNTGSRYYEPDDLDRVMQDDSVSNLQYAPSGQASAHNTTMDVEEDTLP